MTQSKVSQLATVVAENTAIVTQYLESHNLPQPTFDIDGPTKSPVPANAEEVAAARLKVIQATEELRALMLGPTEYLLDMPNIALISVQAVARFDIPHTFELGQETTFKQIANQIGLSESTTKRLVRDAVAQGIFTEPTPGTIAHNAVSKAMLQEPFLLSQVESRSGDAWRGAAHTVEALRKYPGSEEAVHSGWNLAHGCDKGFYQHLGDNPRLRRTFGESMAQMMKSLAPVDPQNYPWAKSGTGLLVDVGGSHGHFCKTMAAAFPKMQFVNQDLPEVIDDSPALSDSESKQIKMMAHDFFTPQPVKDADYYFLRWILHGYGDNKSINILRNLIPALRPGSMIVIEEQVLPVPGTVDPKIDRILRRGDMMMMLLNNSKERELEEWKELFAAADSRFHFEQVNQPQGARLAIIQFVWKP